MTHHNIDRMQREMAAKSGKIAPFVFVNSGKFQQLSFAQFSSAMFVSRVLSCTAFWDTHFVKETKKMTQVERVTRPRIKQSQSP